ncbi:MAG: TatD family hydrolase [Patescibacteria group bacterium]|jgi:TatD DNase family protein
MAILVDTHTHVNFQPFLNDYRVVLQRAIDKNIGLINVGTQWESSQRSVLIADELGGDIYAAVGLHPLHLLEDVVEAQAIGESVQIIKTRAETFIPDNYKKLALSSKRVKAIGECGLDYYHGRGYAEKQNEVLRQHIELAQDLKLPVIIHCRDAATHTTDTVAAFDDLLKILNDYKNNITGTIHCYTGTPQYIPKFLELGFYIGFTGIVTFPSAKEVQASARLVPLDRLLLETDAPYLAPIPKRGKRNEPSFVEFVARHLADIKGISYTDLVKQTTKNAKDLFHIS